MLVPGSNLLGIALGVIGAQTPTYFERTGRTKDAVGVWSTTFAPGVEITGSWQPLDKKTIALLGLDMAKDYNRFVGPRAFNTVDDDQGADEFEYGGKRWRVTGKVEWVRQDGWSSVIVVDIGNA